MLELNFIIEENFGKYQVKAWAYAFHSKQIMVKIEGVSPVMLTNQGFDQGPVMDSEIFSTLYALAELKARDMILEHWKTDITTIQTKGEKHEKYHNVI